VVFAKGAILVVVVVEFLDLLWLLLLVFGLEKKRRKSDMG